MDQEENNKMHKEFHHKIEYKIFLVITTSVVFLNQVSFLTSELRLGLDSTHNVFDKSLLIMMKMKMMMTKNSHVSRFQYEHGTGQQNYKPIVQSSS